MSEANKAVARRYYEELWEGNLGVADQIFAPKVIGHAMFINPVDTVTGVPIQGSDESTPEEEKAGVTVWREELRGLHATVNEILEDGDKVIALDLQGITPAIRQKLQAEGILLGKVKGKKKGE